MTVRIPLYQRGVVVAHALVDDDFSWLAKWRWRLSHDGYPVRMSGPDANRHEIRMNRVVLGLERGDELLGDHVDHNKLDNRRANLRPVTNQQNQQSRLGGKAGSTTGLRGVSKGKRGRWRSYCGNRYLGSFSTPEHAAKVAEAARREAGYLTVDAGQAQELVSATSTEPSPGAAP